MITIKTQTKNNITLEQPQAGLDRTWDESNMTWDENTDTWNKQTISTGMTEQSKNNISLNLPTK